MERFKSSSGAPSWWFGAPLFGVLFGFVANRFFPEFVQSVAVLIYRVSGNGPALGTISLEATRFLAPLVGMVLAVIVLGTWHVVRNVTHRREPS